MDTSSQVEKDRALLKKYQAGLCSPEEIERIEKWYNSFDQAPLPDAAAEKSSLDKVAQSLLEHVRVERTVTGKVFPFRRFLRVAATVLFFMSVSLGIYFAMDSGSGSLREYHALNGEQKIVTLDDGSIVTLNAGSILRIYSDFGTSTREVLLTGEAFFAVAKDSLRPFIVSSGDLQTRVLGTSFNVQAYENESDLTVTVAEGKVRVDKVTESDPSSNLSPGITPGNQLVYNKSTQEAAVMPADVEQITAWKKGVLYFNDESIPAIARKLERRFNVTINVVGESSPDCLYTLRISDDTLDKSLMLLTGVSGITYTFSKPDQLTLNTSACH